MLSRQWKGTRGTAQLLTMNTQPILPLNGRVGFLVLEEELFDVSATLPTRAPSFLLFAPVAQKKVEWPPWLGSMAPATLSFVSNSVPGGSMPPEPGPRGRTQPMPATPAPKPGLASPSVFQQNTGKGT